MGHLSEQGDTERKDADRKLKCIIFLPRKNQRKQYSACFAQWSLYETKQYLMTTQI